MSGMGRESDLSIERIGVALGAIVHNLDLRGLTDRDAGTLEAALYEHQVLFFRDQHLSDAEFLAFAGRFGQARVSQPGRFLKETDPLIWHERAPDSPPRTERWHTDTPFVEDPPVAGLLSALTVPSVGGETAWASAYSLYDALSPPMQRFCTELKGEHKTDATIAYVHHKHGAEAAQRVAQAFPTRLHPIVQSHHRTGRKHLYLGATMSSIAELTPAESAMVLRHLRDGLNDLNIQIRWRWAVGDVAIWDQHSTLHKALTENLAKDERRVLRSVFVDRG